VSDAFDVSVRILEEKSKKIKILVIQHCVFKISGVVGENVIATPIYITIKQT